MSPWPRSTGSSTSSTRPLEQLGRAIALKPEVAALYRTRALLEPGATRPGPGGLRRGPDWISNKPSDTSSPGSQELARDHAKRG